MKTSCDPLFEKVRGRVKVPFFFSQMGNLDLKKEKKKRRIKERGEGPGKEHR